MRSKLVPAFVAVAFLLAPAAQAADVVLYSVSCGASPEYFPQALAAAGVDFDLVTTGGQLATAILSGHYRWVIVDKYNDSLSPEDVAALTSFVGGGGCSYISDWQWYEYPELAGAYGATFISDYTTPIPILRWNPGHPLFTTPNALNDLTPATDTCDRDGERFEPTAGASAIAGYVAAPAPNEAGFVVGNDGRTVLFGGITGLFSGDGNTNAIPDGQELAENVVAYLGTQTCALAGGHPLAIPTVSGSGLAALTLLLAAAALVALRRRG